MGYRTLDVSLCGKPVGTLYETSRGPRFAYNEVALNNFPGQPLLSVCLPVKKRPYSKGLTEA